MANLWQSFLAHWAIPVASWIFGTFVGGAFRWRYGSYKEWTESHKDKLASKTDAKVLREMRMLCDGNSSIYKTTHIAETLDMDLDETADSLERLESMGRVQIYDVGDMDDPGPGWRSKFR